MTSPLPAVRFNFAQTFYVDPATITGQTHLKISSINMYFKYKPAAVGNRSGINNPGITIYLTETIYGVPVIDNNTIHMKAARCEWNQIITSSNATIPTTFTFLNPITVKPGQQYAIVVSFDGNEVFWPWTAKIGEYIVGTSTLYTGSSNELIGKYYEYGGWDSVDSNFGNPVASGYNTAWLPLDDTQLKFDVYAVRYFIEGVPLANLVANTLILPPSTQVRRSNIIQSTTGAGHLKYEFPSQCMEQITFSISNSTVQSFIGAQKVYQNTVPYPGGFVNGANYIEVATVAGEITVTANASYPNGAAFDWADVYADYVGLKYIVLLGGDYTNVRKVRTIVNSSVIVVDEPVSFTNAATKFLVSPVATVDGMATNSPQGKKTEFLWLTHSNANSTVRFVNNCIEAITVGANGGSGYDNTDILYVKGFQNVENKVIGGYIAVGNIVTNSTGGIETIHMANLGCGFVNTAEIVAVLCSAAEEGNTTSNTSAGSDAEFVYDIGATLQTELTNNIFKNCTVVNLDVNDVTPFFTVNKPAGTQFDLQVRFQYYIVNDDATYSGYAYYIYPEVGGQAFNDIQLLSRNKIVVDKTPCFVSYSNEFVTPYINGDPNDLVNPYIITSNNIVLGMDTYSNNDFICAIAESFPTIEFGKYIINDDYTGEETNFGNAWAKHLTTRINFTRLSEDIRVYIEAYKPANTDIQVYARIQNSGDPDAFDDAEWTRLQLIDGTKVVSSLNKFDDYIDLTYGFQPYPNTEVVLDGVVFATNASANLVGVGTTFDDDLIADNMIRIYDPLFPNTNFMVATVESVNSNTSLTLDQIVNSENGSQALVQADYGLRIEKLGWVDAGYNTGEYIHQGYNNITFDNVVRYYNTSIIKYDGYDILQLKIVLLNTHLGHIPRIHNIRCVGVSA